MISRQHVINKPVIIFLSWLILLATVWGAIASKGVFNDEHDNWVGGQLLVQGAVPYRDFFSHHAPLTYYVSAAWQILGNPSPEWMRLGIMIFWFASFAISYKCAPTSMRKFVGASFFTSALVAPLVSAQMFLAESFVAIIFMSLLWCGYIATLKLQNSHYMLLIVALLSGLVVLYGAPVYLFSFGIFLSYMGLRKKLSLRMLLSNKKTLMLFSMLYLVIPLLLINSEAINDFKLDFIDFNNEIYYPIRLRHTEVSAINSLLIEPLKNNWISLSNMVNASEVLLFTTLTTIRQFLMGLPFEQAKEWFLVGINAYFNSLGNIETIMRLVLFSCSIILLSRRKYSLAIFYLATLLYLGVRNSELFHSSILFFGIITYVWITIYELQGSNKLGKYLFGFIVIGSICSMSLPYYMKIFSQTPMHFYPASLTTESILYKYSLQDEVIQNLSPDVGLFSKVPTLKSATRMLYYYPWINASEPLRAEVLNSLQTGSAKLVYTSGSLDYAPEIEQVLLNNYSSISENLLIRR